MVCLPLGFYHLIIAVSGDFDKASELKLKVNVIGDKAIALLFFYVKKYFDIT